MKNNKLAQCYYCLVKADTKEEESCFLFRGDISFCSTDCLFSYSGCGNEDK